MFRIADRLHKTIEEIEAMPRDLFLETIAFYNTEKR